MATTPKVLYRGLVSAPAYQWVQRTLPVAGSWQPGGCAYGNGVFVLLANSSGNCYTSPDGITWTARSMPVSAGWTAVTFGGGLFAAVATGSTIAATSPDGITWTQRTLPASQSWTAVTYGSGGFFAIGSGANGALSANGTTWTQRSVGVNVNWASASFGNGIYLITGNSTTAVTSPDGVTWTQRTLPAGYSNWNTSTFGNGTFVVAAVNTSAAATSPDGITWTQRTLPYVLGWQGLAYGSGLHVGAGGYNPGTSAISTDNGVTWTGRLLPPVGENTWVALAHGNGTFFTANQATANGATMSVSSTSTVLYTAPASTTAVLTALLISNSMSSATVSVTIDGFTLVQPTTLATGASLDLRLKEVIAAGKTLAVMTTAPVGVHASGVEIT